MSVEAQYVTVEEIEIDRLHWIEAKVVLDSVVIRLSTGRDNLKLVFRRSDPEGEARLHAIIKAVEAVNEAEPV